MSENGNIELGDLVNPVIIDDATNLLAEKHRKRGIEAVCRRCHEMLVGNGVGLDEFLSWAETIDAEETTPTKLKRIRAERASEAANTNSVVALEIELEKEKSDATGQKSTNGKPKRGVQLSKPKILKGFGSGEANGRTSEEASGEDEEVTGNVSDEQEEV